MKISVRRHVHSRYVCIEICTQLYTDKILSMSVCIHGQKRCQELERTQICVISYVIISVKTQTETDRYMYLHVNIPPAPPGLSKHYSAPVFQRQVPSKMYTDCIKIVSDYSTQYTGLKTVPAVAPGAPHTTHAGQYRQDDLMIIIPPPS